MILIERPLSEVESEIVDGDLLLKQGNRWRPLDLPIMVTGRSPHTHAGMVARNEGGRLECLEMMQGVGGRAVPLDEYVERFPGRLDIYSSDPDCRWPEFDRALAAQTMREFIGTEYGWLNVARAALLHTVFVRLFVRPETDDDVRSGYPAYCSHSYALSVHAGGVDVVPNLADRLTEVGDLFRSMFFRYLCTLVP